MNKAKGASLKLLHNKQFASFRPRPYGGPQRGAHRASKAAGPLRSLTSGYGLGLDDFWTYARKRQIFDLPTEKGAAVLRTITRKFQGQVEGFSGASGQHGFSAGASSSAAPAASSLALVALGDELENVARRAWASIAHALRSEMGGDTNWTEQPAELSGMQSWFDDAHNQWAKTTRQLTTMVHRPGADLRDRRPVVDQHCRASTARRPTA